MAAGAAPLPAPEAMTVDSILAKYGNAAGGLGYIPGQSAAPDPGEEPGLIEAGARGLKQGLSLGFGDELTGLIESAFTDKTYKQARNEARANDARAKEAHPWGYGLGEVLGNVGVGVATGGVAGVAAKAGTAGVAALAGAEGAIQGAGNSEAEDLGGIAKDAAIGGAAGAALGAAGNKLFGRYANTAVERHAKHIAEDVTEGANMVQARRFAKVQELAADVFDKDPELRKALGNPAKALDVVDQRFATYGPQTGPIYQKIDAAFRPMTIGEAMAPVEAQIAKYAQEPGKETIAAALERSKDNFVSALSRSRVWAGKIEDMPVPTQTVRRWTSNLLSEADHTLGSIAETERYRIKDELHSVADRILKDHIDDAAKAVPALKPEVAELTDLNKKLRVLNAAKEALEVRATKESIGRDGLAGTLKKIGLPSVVGLGLASADPISGGIGFAAAKGVGAAAKGLDRSATTALARLVKATRAGSVTKALVLDAVRAGVPTATVQGLLGTARNLPDDVREAPSALFE